MRVEPKRPEPDIPAPRRRPGSSPSVGAAGPRPSPGNRRIEPTWRQPAGIGLILLWIALWCVAIVSASSLIAGLPWPVHAFYYLVAGIAWILPLKPLLRWMETGRWRA